MAAVCTLAKDRQCCPVKKKKSKGTLGELYDLEFLIQLFEAVAFLCSHLSLSKIS